MYRNNDEGAIAVVAFKAKVFGLDRATGNILWKTVLSPYASTVVELAVGANLVVACSNQHLAFIEYQTGRLLRSVELGESGRRTLLIDGDQILVSAQGVVSCYTRSGDHVWDQPFKGEGYGEVAMAVPGVVRQADDRGSK